MNTEVEELLKELWKKHYPNSTDWKIRLLTTNLKLLFVEGPIDYRYYLSLLDEQKVKVFLPSNKKDKKNGRANVCKCVKVIIGEYPKRVYGICDRDLLSFDIGNHTGENILHTDTHDLELDAIKHSDFETFIIMKVKPNSLAPKKIIQLALKLCEPVGLLRLISEKENLRIDFDNFEFSVRREKKSNDIKQNQICESNYTPNVEVIVRKIIQKNKRHLNTVSGLVSTINSQIGLHDLYQVCNGHDFVSALRLILKDYWGLKISVETTESLSISILGNYHKSYFLQSDLGKELQKVGLL